MDKTTGRLFQLGTKVRFKEAFLEKDADDKKRYQGRIGEVAGYRMGANDPIVLFPRNGRRKEQKVFEVFSSRLEIVAE